MKKTKACGVLVFRRQPQLSFLLMKHPHRYDLPKGHIEEGETEEQCALREMWEETGISFHSVRLQPGFRYSRQFSGVDCAPALATSLGAALRSIGLPE